MRQRMHTFRVILWNGHAYNVIAYWVEQVLREEAHMLDSIVSTYDMTTCQFVWSRCSND